MKHNTSKYAPVTKYMLQHKMNTNN